MTQGQPRGNYRPNETPGAGQCFRIGFLWLLAAVAALVVAGCETDERWVPPAIVDPAATIFSTNVLHAGDVVEVTFQYTTNFNTTQRIGLDGMLNLNSVGTIRAAGKTVTELQEDVTKAYKSLAKGDVITVNRVLNSVPVVYVAGAVLKPGEVELDRPMTVLEAVMAGGGFDVLHANLADCSVLRIENGRQTAYPINLKRLLQGKDNVPFYLKPFDIIYIPTKVFNY